MPRNLLEAKPITASKMASAAALALCIVGGIAWFLHGASVTMVDKHIDTQKAHPSHFVGTIVLFPVFTAIGLFLTIPLFVYVTDHAAFSNLHVINPVHYGRLLVRVYRSWLRADGGKLSSKEL